MKKKLMILCVFLMVASFVNAQTIISSSDFEKGTVDNWTGRGSAKLTIADKDARQGKYSLLTTDRSDGWNGPQLDLTGKIFLNGVYRISAWVKLQAGAPASEVIITVQRDKAGNSQWDRVLAETVKPNTWVNLSGDYAAHNDFDNIVVYIESSNPALAYYIDDITVTTVKDPSQSAQVQKLEVKSALDNDLPALCDVYKKYFQIGTAVEMSQLKGEEGDIILKHFSSLTAENIMKPGNIAQTEYSWFFDQPDELVKYAQAHKKLIRGHTLLWHQQAAEWMFYDDDGKKVSRDVLLKRLEKYIKTSVSRYKGKVYAWDVVNEPIDGPGLRKSLWLEIIGEDYIEKALTFAHQADPKAKLFINDYETTDKVKGETLYNLIKKLKAKKVPIDGVGMQFHISLEQPTLQAITDSLKKFSDLGIEIHITELDVSMNGDPKFNPPQLPDEMAIQQGHRYKEIFEAFKQFKNITSVTLWGFSDNHTWLHSFPVAKADWPLPFDEAFNAKYAYWGMVDPAKLPANVVVTHKAKDSLTAVAKKGTPVIDGKEDEAWKIAPTNDIALYVEGQGATGTGKVLWDVKGLYLFIKVKDPKLSKKSSNAYEQDSVEIFIDEKNNKLIDYAEDDAQYRVNFDNEQSTGSGYPAEIKSVTAITKDGYNLEVMVPFKGIKGVAGTKIGFDLQINDDDGSGKRTSIAKWNDPTNESYRNTSNFGTLVLE